MRSLVRVVGLGFGAAIFVVAAAGMFAFERLRAADDAAHWVDHTHEVLETLDAVVAAATDGETGERGYLLTGEPRYLAPFERAHVRAAVAVARVGQLTADDPTEELRTKTLGALVAARFAELSETVRLYDTQGPEAALAVVRSDRGQAAMEAIRTQVSVMRARERMLLAARAAREESTAALARTLLAVSLAAALLIGAEALLIVRRDTRRRERAEAALTELSVSDELTGLLNRRGFTQLAERELRRARRAKRPAIVLYGDLDGFKGINDRFGHAEGDAALKEVASVLRTTLRDTDVVARFGGDEFAVLAAETGDAPPELIIGRIREAMIRHNAERAEAGRPYAIAMSLGTAHFQPLRPVPLTQLLATADARLYSAKAERKRRPSGTTPVVAVGTPAAPTPAVSVA